jgi:hypothetical protein
VFPIIHEFVQTPNATKLGDALRNGAAVDHGAAMFHPI